jgi:uncharacterized protein with HEPN domain
MRRETSDASRVADMLRYSEYVVAIVGSTPLDVYLADNVLRLAVERCLHVIGEAANHVSESFCVAHPEVPWGRIVGQRNFLSHDYSRIDHVRLWRLATEDVPQLIETLRRLLPPENE